MKKLFLILILIIFIQCQNLIYNPIIGSNMVLQRDSPNTKIWGQSSQSVGSVKVEFTSRTALGFSETAQVVNHKWVVYLRNIPAGGPYDVTVTDLKTLEKQTFTNVFFGDVFLCSGQSNMEWPLSAILNASKEIEDAKNYPLLRMFKVER